jgi:hypothetical protein
VTFSWASTLPPACRIEWASSLLASMLTPRPPRAASRKQRHVARAKAREAGTQTPRLLLTSQRATDECTAASRPARSRFVEGLLSTSMAIPYPFWRVLRHKGSCLDILSNCILPSSQQCSPVRSRTPQPRIAWFRAGYKMERNSNRTGRCSLHRLGGTCSSFGSVMVVNTRSQTYI